MKLEKSMIKLNQDVPTRDQAIRMAGQLLVDGGCVEPEYIDSMIARNNDVSTYMGNFIAIPHGTDDGKKYIKKTGISVVQIPMGVDFSNPDDDTEQLVTVVFGIDRKRKSKIRNYLFTHGFSSSEINAFLDGDIIPLDELSEY